MIGRKPQKGMDILNAALEARRSVELTVAQTVARTLTLADYSRHAWKIIEPATPLVWGWHMQVVCDHLQALLEGRLAKRNLLIAIPPGSAKSTLVSVMLPTWWWINHPEWRATFASGNPTVSTRDSLKSRQILDSDWYKSTFGIAWMFASDANLKTYFENSARGFRSATTTGSRVTGSRPHALFVDDSLDAADAYSKASRDAVLNWWDNAYANRLADLQHGTRVIIAQRLHVEDLLGHVLDLEPDLWECLVIPTEWEESRRYTTSLGWTDPRTEEGALMFEARFPRPIIEQEKVRLGISGFAGQHQQRPSIAGGEVFKSANLRLIAATDLPKQYTQIILSLDTAFKTGQESDYSVCAVIGQTQFGYVLLHIARGRFAYPQLQTLAEQLALTWGPSAVLIEDKASGQSLIQSLRQTTNLPIVPVNPDGDKQQRAIMTVPLWDAGRVYAVQDAPWLPDFLEEMQTFPKGKHDDQVDAVTQGLRWLNEASGPMKYLAMNAAPADEAPPPWSAQPKSKMLDRIQNENLVTWDQTSPWHR